MATYGIDKKLTAAGIPFREETFFSNFHGTRFIFKTRKIAMQAEKATGIECRRYIKEWAITVY